MRGAATAHEARDERRCRLLSTEIDRIAALEAEASWSICIRRDDSSCCAGHGAETVLPTASVGKVLLLAEIARRIEADPAVAGLVLDRSATDPVGEAGLWQRLRIDALAVSDLACLVGAMSDNLATNVLLDHFGLPAVQALTAALGLRSSALLDRIRTVRVGGDPPHPSAGNASEWSEVFARIETGSLVSAGVSRQLRDWLSGNADLSMVVAPFGFDPLAHPATHRRRVYNKTGSDPGTRADVGHVALDGTGIAYAVVVRWPAPDTVLQERILVQMRSIGAAIRQFIEDATTPGTQPEGEARCGSIT